MLTASELASMAAERESVTMRESATIVRHTVVDDGYGGTNETTVETVVPCFRYPNGAGANEPVVAGQLAQGLVWTLGFPVGTDVKRSDTVNVGSESYEVIAILGPYSHQTATLVYARPR